MNRSSARVNVQVAAMRGFTLIELMVTVAVIGIIAAIAYPSYTSYIVKTHRAAAQSHLMDLAQRQQQFLTDNRVYTTDVNSLVTTPSDVAARYTIGITAPAVTPPTFTITATPKAGSSQIGDGAISITHTGVKSPAGKW